MSSSLLGVRIGGFRSLGQSQDLDLTSRMTLLAGANNVGKSNVIRFLRDVVPKLPNFLRHQGAPLRWGPLDPPNFVSSHEPLIAGAQISRDVVSAASGKLAPKPQEVLKELLNVLDGGEDSERFTLSVALRAAGEKWTFSWAEDTLAQILSIPLNRLHVLAGGVLSGSTSNHERQAAELLGWLGKAVQLKVPRVVVVPAFRQVEHGDESEPWSGHRIIERLAALQHPPVASYKQDQARFDHLNQLVRSVTEDPEARIEIPNDKSTIHVHLDGRVVPLEALGTGLHEVILIGAAATVERNAMVCLEEPEAHLHPLLQRRLLAYLRSDTENQYVIATHSAHVLDAEQSTIVHVSLEGGSTRLEEVMTPGDRWRICQELGYRASDLIQSNFVIWVEGPSDRVYINYWLAQHAPELEEGTHYSVMFYGGRLLSHLTVDDGPDLIELLPINRNVAVLMDRDTSNQHQAVGSTKQRISNELSRTGGLAWVTAGREIENYVTPSSMKKAHAFLGKSAKTRMRRFDRMYAENINKMALALSVTGVEPVFRLDLEERVEKLAMRIKAANGMGAP